MWGKGDSGNFANLPGGYSGPQSRRINRYIAERLGPVPGWSMGIGWEHWSTTTSDGAIAAGLAAIPDRPMMSEDRFRRRDNAWRQKDMHADDDILKKIPRWATRGVAAIYGRLIDRREGGSDIWSNKAAIKTVIKSVGE